MEPNAGVENPVAMIAKNLLVFERKPAATAASARVAKTSSGARLSDGKDHEPECAVQPDQDGAVDSICSKGADVEVRFRSVRGSACACVQRKPSGG